MKIKTCPFCNEEVTIQEVNSTYEKTKFFEISCENSNCERIVFVEGFNKEELIKLWNTRKGK